MTEDRWQISDCGLRIADLKSRRQEIALRRAQGRKSGVRKNQSKQTLRQFLATGYLP
jgi:hypothetical protein